MNKSNIITTIATIFMLLLGACTSNNQGEVSDSNLYRIMVGDKYGFMDCEGNIIIDPQFDAANEYFSEGLCFVRIGDRKGFIDSTGNFTVEFADSVKFTDHQFQKGLLGVHCFGDDAYKGCAIVNKQGEFVVEANYNKLVKINVDGDNLYLQSVFPLSFILDITENIDYGLLQQDSAIASYNELYSNMPGHLVGAVYDSALGFHNGMCAVKKDSKWGFMDRSGELVIDAVYDSVQNFTEDSIALVRSGAKHIYISYDGSEILSVDSALSNFHCHRAAAIIGGTKCLIDKNGNKVCDLNVDKVYTFLKDNMATVIKNGKASKIDTLGNIVLQTKYEKIGSFIDGVAPVSLNDKYGYIDTAGKEIINVSFDGTEKDLHNENHKIRSVYHSIDGLRCYSYYDLQGNLIWQDIPPAKKFNPKDTETLKKSDYIEYFRSNLSTLDPIEGLYYVTLHDIYVDRDNPNKIGSNGTKSKIYAIIRDPGTNDYICYWVDDDEHPGWVWAKEFIKLGEGNTYAVTDYDPKKPYGDDTRLVLENPYKFEIPIETGRNNRYNFYCNHEFVKEYPTASEYEQATQPEWSGSGFAIADGIIATNYHVINGAKRITIKGVDGEIETAYNGYVLASDKEHDIAIIKIVDKNFKGFGKIPYCVGKSIADVGEDVFALGYPLTTTMGNEIKLTNGIISSTSGFQGDASMYQISVPIQPGNSGGPLFDDDGIVVGIVTAKHAEAENANYAVKINYLASLIANNHLDIKLADSNKTKGKSLKKQVKMVKNFVYLIECRN